MLPAYSHPHIRSLPNSFLAHTDEHGKERCNSKKNPQNDAGDKKHFFGSAAGVEAHLASSPAERFPQTDAGLLEENACDEEDGEADLYIRERRGEILHVGKSIPE